MPLTSCTPSALLASMGCWQGLSRAQADAAMTYLLISVQSGSGGLSGGILGEGGEPILGEGGQPIKPEN